MVQPITDFDPEMGQYTQQDPIGLAGGNPTLYGYVSNPNTEIDEYGLSITNYVVTNVLGRKVYQRDGLFGLGTPSVVDSSVHPSIRNKINNGWTNLDLMKAGNSPIGIDGKQINLHHVIGKEPGPMVEILSTTHKKYHGPLHGLIENGKSFRNNKALKNSYTKFKSDYWQERAKGFAKNAGCKK